MKEGLVYPEVLNQEIPDLGASSYIIVRDDFLSGMTNVGKV